MRIVVIRSSAMWTGAIQEQIFLKVPQHMNLGAEEELWFATGGGTPRDFACFLVSKGARELGNVETWDIRYQS